MDDNEEGDSDEDDYDFDPREMEYGMDGEMDDESDELDGVEIAEIDTDEDEAPKLVAAAPAKKGKNKRSAEEAEGLDAMIAQAEDPKLSKKQQKKLKNNKGEAIAAEEKKSVKFAKNLEQGPTGSAEKAKSSKAESSKAATSVKVVQGVTLDDRTLGTGRQVKNGDQVGVRYIGKLSNGQVFDGKTQFPHPDVHC